MNLMKMVTFSASAEVMMASFSAGPLPEVVRLTVFTALCQACTWEAWRQDYNIRTDTIQREYRDCFRTSVFILQPDTP